MNNPVVQPIEAPCRYSKGTVVFSWLSLAVGYLYCRAFLITDRPFYGFLFTLALFLFGFFALKNKAPLKKGTLRSLFYPISALILNCSLFFSGAPLLQFFVFVYSVLSFLLFCHFKGENRMESLAGSLYFFDLAGAVLIAPFTSFFTSVLAIFSEKRGKKLAQGLLLTLCGLLLALLPTLLVLGLLSFDQNFNRALESILEFSGEQLFSRIVALLFGVPVGMYFFGAVYASNSNSAKFLSASFCRRARSVVAFSPAIVGVVALLPLLFLYGIFIFAQKDYYGAVLSGTLPASHTFSSFARDGFFRLIAVAVINLFCLVSLRLFTKKSSKGKPSFAVTLSTVVLSLVTVVLCATALSQMGMYVSAYGLTRLRLYALWFMSLLALLFLLIALCRVIPRIPFAPIAIPLFFLCFALLALPDSDAVIAKHNYNCYLKGNTADFDLKYMAELGPSAIPTLCKIAEREEDRTLQEKARLMLAEYETKKEFSIKKLTLPTLLANTALKDLDKETRDRIKTYKELYFSSLPIEVNRHRFTTQFKGTGCGTMSAYTVEKDRSDDLLSMDYQPYSKAALTPYFDLFLDLPGTTYHFYDVQEHCQNDKNAIYLVKELTPGTPEDGFVAFFYLPTKGYFYTLTYFPFV